MTYQELLDELSGPMLRDRSDLIAGPSDEAWGDATLLSYIADAERRFARRTLCLRDSTTEALTQVELEEGVQNYVLSPLVIAVMSARYNLDDRDLPRSAHAEAGGGYVQAFRGWDPNSGVMPGRPYGWWTDESVGANQRVTLRIDSLPTAADAGALLYLRICRLPLAVASADNLDSSPEIAEEYHLDLLEWAAYRALRNHDVDTEQAEKRDDHKARWEEVIKEVRNENMKRMHAGVGWRFGANGFSYAGNS